MALREVRLSSLRSDPTAFGSTYEREVALPREWWKGWSARSEDGTNERTFVLVNGQNAWVGIACVRHDEANPHAA
jgi:hypothetical protein